MIRKKIYNIISVGKEEDKCSRAYDFFMMVVILFSILPLCFKEQKPIFTVIDRVTVTIFIIDYMLRLITADYQIPQHKKEAFIIYPFTPMAIIDLLSILPSITALNRGLRVFKILRLFRSFRVFKFVRYSKSLNIIISVFRKEKKPLLAVCYMAVGYIFISALIIFQIEPKTFNTFFDALYWATVSLTTVGYGDIYPLSNIGRLISMLSSVFGIAFVALPSGILTAGYMDEIKKRNSN